MLDEAKNTGGRLDEGGAPPNLMRLYTFISLSQQTFQRNRGGSRGNGEIEKGKKGGMLYL
jgi:hypothetical protein